MNDERDVTLMVAEKREPRVCMVWEPPDVTLTRTDELGRVWLAHEGEAKLGTSVAFLARVVRNPTLDDPTARAAESVVEYMRNFIAEWAKPEHAEGLTHPPSVVMAAPELLAACKAAEDLISLVLCVAWGTNAEDREQNAAKCREISRKLGAAIAKAGGAA